MNDKQAIEKLQALTIELSNLPQYKPGEINSEFDKWRRKTRLALENIFGASSSNLSEFVTINYVPQGWAGFNPYTMEISKNDYFKAYNAGILHAKSLLEGFIVEVEEYGAKDQKINILTEIRLIEKILVNFHRSYRQLLIRHDNRQSLEIHDEYDVQDLLHAILKLYFDDVRAEITTPQYAGGNSRIDFYLNDHDIAIEVKKTRAKLKDKEIGEELLIDIARYQKSFPKIKLLVCFVYDPEGVIKNPVGIENDLMKTPSEIEIKAIICPKF